MDAGLEPKSEAMSSLASPSKCKKAACSEIDLFSRSEAFIAIKAKERAITGARVRQCYSSFGSLHGLLLKAGAAHSDSVLRHPERTGNFSI